MENEAVYWETVQSISSVIEELLVGVCLSQLVKPFFDNKKRSLYIGVIYFLYMLMLFIGPLQFDSLTVYGVGGLVVFVAMCRMERRNYRQKAFLAVTFVSLRCLSFAMASILQDMLYGWAEETEYMQTHLNMWFALYVGMCAFYLLLGGAVMAAATHCILRSYRYKSAEMSKKELLMLVIPSLFGMTGYKIIKYYRVFYILETEKIFVSYDIILVFYYALALAAIVAVIVLYQNIKAGQEDKIQSELFAVQVESIQHHLEQADHLYQDIRGIKHDMTNHILTLERLYAGDRTTEAREYGEELKAALMAVSGGINSGNVITDVILCEAQREADRRRVRFEIDFHYPEGSDVNVFDISVILNNALYNALEYVSKENPSYISIRSYRRHNAYMIEVSNSFTGSLRWEAESGLPMTSKEQKEGDGAVRGCQYERSHGYGLSNIRKAAQKYAGDIAIDVKDGRFCLSILLMLEQ